MQVCAKLAINIVIDRIRIDRIFKNIKKTVLKYLSKLTYIYIRKLQ